MITSTHRHTFQKAFTLLEIVIVLLIIGIIIGGSIAAISFNSAERALTNQSSEIEMLAKKARTSAILHQTPYVIEFHPGMIKLFPLSSGNRSNQPAKAAAHETLNINPDIILTMRYWNTKAFITPSDNLNPVWRFDPDGLCEPITVRLTLDDSYAQDTYHPLTADIADSELEAN